MMLSQFHGDSTEDYPNLLRDNLKYRENLIILACQDEDFKKDLCLLFRNDPIWAVNTWFWTFDPRNGTGDKTHLPKDMPFIFYNYQIQFFSEIIRKILINPGDLLIDKSRDMGATWLVLAAFLWCWICIPNFQVLVGSRKEDLVDNWMIDSHFGKLRYMLTRLPEFLKPFDFKAKIHDTKLNLYNPSNGSSIQGEATSPNFSRQGRYNVVYFDEFAFWENDKEAWAAASDSSPCRIATSTPNGLMTQFAIIRFSGNTDVLSFHWTEHPDKMQGSYIDNEGVTRSKWYDEECKRRDFNKLAIAQELDIDYISSGRPVFDMTKVNIKLKELRSNSPTIKRGDLHWYEKPLYNEYGICTNKDSLKVKFIPNTNGNLLVYKDPDSFSAFSFRYCISADSSEGLEQGDFDVAAVLDRSSMTKRIVIAELRGHWSPHLYATELAKLGVFYGYCPIWPEKNNMGHAVIEKLFEIYTNIGHEKYQDNGMLREFSDKLGWVTNQISKPIMIDNLSKMINEDLYEDPFIGFWEECVTFVIDPRGKMSAQNKKKGGKFFDDRIISRAILLQADRYLPVCMSIKPKTEDEKLTSEHNSELERFMDYLRQNTQISEETTVI